MAARLKGAVPENENIGLLWAKHRNFRGKSTALLCKEVRCFQFPENALFWRGGKVWNGGRSKRQRDSDRKGVEQHTSCPSAGVSMSSLLLHFLPKSMVFDPHLGETRLFSSELSCNFALPIFCKNQSKKRESLIVRHRINRQTLLAFRFSEYFCRVKYNVES